MLANPKNWSPILRKSRPPCEFMTNGPQVRRWVMRHPAEWRSMKLCVGYWSSDSVISLNILWPVLIDPLRLFVILLCCRNQGKMWNRPGCKQQQQQFIKSRSWWWIVKYWMRHSSSCCSATIELSRRAQKRVVNSPRLSFDCLAPPVVWAGPFIRYSSRFFHSSAFGLLVPSRWSKCASTLGHE